MIKKRLKYFYLFYTINHEEKILWTFFLFNLNKQSNDINYRLRFYKSFKLGNPS